jgi:hypothetical protein
MIVTGRYFVGKPADSVQVDARSNGKIVRLDDEPSGTPGGPLLDYFQPFAQNPVDQFLHPLAARIRDSADSFRDRGFDRKCRAHEVLH